MCTLHVKRKYLCRETSISCAMHFIASITISLSPKMLKLMQILKCGFLRVSSYIFFTIREYVI